MVTLESIDSCLHALAEKPASLLYDQYIAPFRKQRHHQQASSSRSHRPRALLPSTSGTNGHVGPDLVQLFTAMLQKLTTSPSFTECLQSAARPQIESIFNGLTSGASQKLVKPNDQVPIRSKDSCQPISKLGGLLDLPRNSSRQKTQAVLKLRSRRNPSRQILNTKGAKYKDRNPMVVQGAMQEQQTFASASIVSDSDDNETEPTKFGTPCIMRIWLKNEPVLYLIC